MHLHVVNAVEVEQTQIKQLTDHPEAGQDPSDWQVPGLCGAKTSRWGLTTETVSGP